MQNLLTFMSCSYNSCLVVVALGSPWRGFQSLRRNHFRSVWKSGTVPIIFAKEIPVLFWQHGYFLTKIMGAVPLFHGSVPFFACRVNGPFVYQFSDQSRNQSPQALWLAVGLLVTNRWPKSLKTMGTTLFSDRSLAHTAFRFYCIHRN